jgi:hypothetical protein
MEGTDRQCSEAALGFVVWSILTTFTEAPSPTFDYSGDSFMRETWA